MPACEWATKPEAVIVHDPFLAGAFDVLDPDARPEDFLFRARPEPKTYGGQHAALVAELRRHIPRVYLLSELAADQTVCDRSGGSLNQVFTRDSLITLPWAPGAYIPARMRPEQRRSETRVLETAVRRLGLHELVRLPPDIFLEGGDVIPFAREGRRSLLVGYGPRSTREAAVFVQESLIPAHLDEVIAIRLADWRMHLDGGFLPVAEDLVLSNIESIVETELLDGAGARPIDLWELLGRLGIGVIEVMREESLYLQACNAVCLGDRRLICYDLCPRVLRLLEDHAVETYPIPGSELVKGRGGPRCMTRPLYAASARMPNSA
jgi:N-dimethylarginine dimethylaminohydrolase